jgi:MFS family permease
MCAFTFTVFLSVFQLLPTAPFRILKLGGDTFAAGLFLGFLTYASAFSAPFTGALGDRFGRRRVLIVCSLAITCFSVAYGFVTNYHVMLALVLFHGVFWSGLLSASAAYMTALIPPDRRAEGIGYWGMATVLATAVAPAMGLAIFRHGWGWVCVSMGLLNVLMMGIAFGLEDTDPPASRFADSRPKESLVEWRIFVVSLSLFLCSFGYGGITSFVALYAERSGVSPRGIFFILFSLSVLATRPFAGRLADRIGAKRVLIPCLALVVIAFGLLAIASTLPRMAAAAILFGLGFGNLYPVFIAHVIRFVPPERHGAAFGSVLAAFDTGIGTGSIAIGWMIKHVGFPKAYGAAALLSALAIPVFIITERRFLLKSRLHSPTLGPE